MVAGTGMMCMKPIEEAGLCFNWGDPLLFSPATKANIVCVEACRSSRHACCFAVRTRIESLDDWVDGPVLGQPVRVQLNWTPVESLLRSFRFTPPTPSRELHLGNHIHLGLVA